MTKFSRLRVLAAIGLIVWLPQAIAMDFSIQGFGSLYGIKPLQSDRYEAFTENTRGQLTFTEGSLLGLNLRADLGEGWSFVGQLLATGARYTSYDEEPDWKLTADWFYAVYNPFEGFNVRVGRQIFPTWLLSEFIDVGFTFPWRKPPFPVYGMSLWKSFNGLSSDYRIRLGELSLTGAVFGGNDKNTYVWGQAGASSEMEIDNLIGGTLTLDGDGWRLRTSASSAKINNLGYFQNRSTFPIQTSDTPYTSDVSMWSVGGRYDKHNIVAYAEYAVERAYNSTTVSVASGGSGGPALGSATGIYGSLGYRIGKFLPWYMCAYGDYKYGFAGVNGIETTHSFGLNYQASSSVIAKVQLDHSKTLNDTMSLNAIGSADTLAAGVDFVF